MILFPFLRLALFTGAQKQPSTHRDAIHNYYYKVDPWKGQSAASNNDLLTSCVQVSQTCQPLSRISSIQICHSMLSTWFLSGKPVTKPSITVVRVSRIFGLSTISGGRTLKLSWPLMQSKRYWMLQLFKSKVPPSFAPPQQVDTLAVIPAAVTTNVLASRTWNPYNTVQIVLFNLTCAVI